jgi:hypothetical protein
MLPKKLAPALFGLILSGLMSLLVSGIFDLPGRRLRRRLRRPVDRRLADGLVGGLPGGAGRGAAGAPDGGLPRRQGAMRLRCDRAAASSHHVRRFVAATATSPRQNPTVTEPASGSSLTANTMNPIRTVLQVAATATLLLAGPCKRASTPATARSPIAGDHAHATVALFYPTAVPDREP